MNREKYDILFPCFLGVVALVSVVVFCIGCDCPTECDVSDARERMTEILESEMRAPVPEPDPLFSDDTPPDPPQPKQETPAGDTDSGVPAEPLKPVPVPAGWPDGMQLQKWTGPNCAPCREWDRLYRAELEAVMLPDQFALDHQNRLTPAASQAGITGMIPQFQLLLNGRVVWHGRGSFTAEQIIERAKQKANQ